MFHFIAKNIFNIFIGVMHPKFKFHVVYNCQCLDCILVDSIFQLPFGVRHDIYIAQRNHSSTSTSVRTPLPLQTSFRE